METKNLVSLSNMCKKHGVSRQSVANWVRWKIKVTNIDGKLFLNEEEQANFIIASLDMHLSTVTPAERKRIQLEQFLTMAYRRHVEVFISGDTYLIDLKDKKILVGKDELPASIIAKINKED